MAKRHKQLFRPNERYWVHEVLPVWRTKKEKYEISDAIWNGRIRTREEEKGDCLEIKLNYLRWQIDKYLQHNVFRQQLTFGHFLKEYILCLGRTAQDIASEINVPFRQLEALMNDEEVPDESILHRLEVHSNHLIVAQQWNRVIVGRKKKRFTSDPYLLEVARTAVKNPVTVSPWGVKKRPGIHSTGLR